MCIFYLFLYSYIYFILRESFIGFQGAPGLTGNQGQPGDPGPRGALVSKTFGDFWRFHMFLKSFL